MPARNWITGTVLGQSKWRRRPGPPFGRLHNAVSHSVSAWLLMSTRPRRSRPRRRDIAETETRARRLTKFAQDEIVPFYEISSYRCKVVAGRHSACLDASSCQSPDVNRSAVSAGPQYRTRSTVTVHTSTKARLNSVAIRIRIRIRIRCCHQNLSFVHWPTANLRWKFHPNPFGSFPQSY